jgi:hypothetical protein
VQYIEAVSDEVPLYKHVLFLAGGITDCPDWQNETLRTVKSFPITVVNPRRKSFDVSDPKESEKQIVWEHQRLRQATEILFWFPKETICPITLFEYGGALERNQKLFVGCHRDYSRKNDLIIQSGLSKFKTLTVHKTFGDLMDDLMYFYLENT